MNTCHVNVIMYSKGNY